MDYRYLKSKHCDHLLHRGVPRTRQGLQDKTLIDAWMKVQRADQFRADVTLKGYLNMLDVRPSQVLAQVHRVSFPAPWRGDDALDHLLFINAVPPSASGLAPSKVESPIAILDYYGGGETGAPGWTALSCTMSFRMDRGRAALLFSTLAVTTDNLLEPGLSQQMIDWACYAAEGTYVRPEGLTPETPRKRVPIASPRRPCKSRRVPSDFTTVPTLSFHLF
ncbi:hypothetical protein C8R46DRAFT_1057443 [Mycena filopes]|nr:hypothetical protein C8R46DRAFT_1057443 [Mycena filopes]